MTALVTADLHFTDNSRDAYRFKLFGTLHRLINKYNISRIFILGDLTEEKDNHNAWLVNKIVKELYLLAQNCQLTILRGNHDYKDVQNPFFGFLVHINNIDWANAPTVTSFRGLGNTLLLPHTHDYQYEWQGLPFDQHWVFTHQCFEGATGGFGHKLEGIPLDIFTPGSQVISGDIHVPQRVGPVTYVGAPYLVDFGDDYQPRMLLLDGTKKTSIPISGPQKRLLELASIDELQTRLGDTDFKGDILKIRICIGMKEYPRWHDYQHIVRAWGELNGYQIHDIQPVVTAGPKVDATIKHKLRETKTDAQLLQEYAAQRGIDERTLKTGLRLVSEQLK